MSEVEPPKKKNKGGRPRIPAFTPDLGPLADKLPPRPINWEQVLYWMNLDATQEEIAGSFHVSVDTLSRRMNEEYGYGFAELKEKACGALKIGLRNNQYKLSAKNAAMAIWLGKIWLGQRDPDKAKESTLLNMLETCASFMDKTRNPVGNDD